MVICWQTMSPTSKCYPFSLKGALKYFKDNYKATGNRIKLTDCLLFSVHINISSELRRKKQNEDTNNNKNKILTLLIDPDVDINKS